MIVDLSLDYPVLATEPFVVSEAAPIADPLRGAVVLDVGVWKVNMTTLGFTFAGRGWGAEWERSPRFVARVWNVDADFGARFEPTVRDGALVSSWWGAGTGLHFGLLAVDWWDDVASIGLGGWLGAGLVVGRGPVRATFSARAGVTLDIDSWTGTVMGNETTTWTYWPGNARVSALAGVAFR